MNSRALLIARGIVLAIGIACCGAAQAADTLAVDFEKSVAPIIVKRCLECHDARNAAGSLVLSEKDRALAGGDSGPSIVPGSTEESYLLERVTAGEMPPPRRGIPQPLPAGEVEQLRAWVAAGAPWPAGRTLDLYEATSDVRGGRDWWSLQPIVRPSPPSQESAGDNPIDAFVLARLQEEGLEMAPEADRPTLIRRLYFDCLGLPPSAEEIEAFASDPSPQAYEALVDRLLASPHFGERWARHWLDVVRFAETCGYERDQVKPHAWRYRDWVVDAINDDKPYDRFVLEQIAGDEMQGRDEGTVIATGFLRLGTWNDEPNDPEEYKYERLEDLVHAVGSAFLGMTVKCARCHDHKFDPIPQTDYYRLASAFWPGPIEPRERELLGGPSKDELGYDVLGWTDVRREPPPLFALKNGDIHRPLSAVDPGPLSMVASLDRPVAPVADAATTGRRLALARWIIDPANPLTARVAVNRLWLHHFGHGLVRSSNNFGFTGEQPTHPELLDWLAAELLGLPGGRGEGGGPAWSLKRMHKLMVMSRTYRQSSMHPRGDEYGERDFDNRLWWRGERRRLDAESIRDAMLSVSGRIDLRRGGPSFYPTIGAEALEGLSRKAEAWRPSPPDEQRRRSLYIFTQRSLLLPFLTTFDFCDTTQPCGERETSTVAPQALVLLNNPFVHEQSESLARRVAEIAGSDPQSQVRTAWRLALGRAPSEREATAAAAHVAAQAEHFSGREEGASEEGEALPTLDSLSLHLTAEAGVQTDEAGRVLSWRDQSEGEHHAEQGEPLLRPVWMENAVGGRPAVRFSGERQFMSLAGQVISQQQFTIFAVVSDAVVSDDEKNGLREIFSNWNGGAGNSVTSVFLGLADRSSVRFSDDFTAPAEPLAPPRHFLLTAVSGRENASVYRDGVELASKGQPLSPRNFSAPYVIGQQGNIDGEFWKGDLAEILVYDRELSEPERRRVESYLSRRYGLAISPAGQPPQFLALASLCHVLLNANEFVYVD